LIDNISIIEQKKLQENLKMDPRLTSQGSPIHFEPEETENHPIMPETHNVVTAHHGEVPQMMVDITAMQQLILPNFADPDSDSEDLEIPYLLDPDLDEDPGSPIRSPGMLDQDEIDHTGFGIIGALFNHIAGIDEEELMEIPDLPNSPDIENLTDFDTRKGWFNGNKDDWIRYISESTSWYRYDPTTGEELSRMYSDLHRGEIPGLDQLCDLIAEKTQNYVCSANYYPLEKYDDGSCHSNVLDFKGPSDLFMLIIGELSSDPTFI
jgi:hypothetical protein